MKHGLKTHSYPSAGQYMSNKLPSTGSGHHTLQLLNEYIIDGGGWEGYLSAGWAALATQSS